MYQPTRLDNTGGAEEEVDGHAAHAVVGRQVEDDFAPAAGGAAVGEQEDVAVDDRLGGVEGVAAGVEPLVVGEGDIAEAGEVERLAEAADGVGVVLAVDDRAEHVVTGVPAHGLGAAVIGAVEAVGDATLPVAGADKAVCAGLEARRVDLAGGGGDERGGSDSGNLHHGNLSNS
ncbi:MAG: hypothetical protein HND58_03070 [Planctomycetota bacterium]|nr:MAG: hypothetical protein HND58_03070 [Planctomycetota bacterium]